mgnify:CR=1 FL=1
MNKSSMRLLVAVGLIALLACSWFMLISNTQKANNAYMTQLDAARAKIKQGLYEDALDFYAAATEQRDSIELRDEIAQVYQDNAGTMAYESYLEGKSLEDRKEIIGVFYNRIVERMSLGSDVTTYYAFKVDMGERDLTVKELNSDNPYNTRPISSSGKLPVGPICNPSESAIEAAINYTSNDYFYFVADKNGKVYFTKTDSEHISKVNELKQKGLL